MVSRSSIARRATCVLALSGVAGLALPAAGAAASACGPGRATPATVTRLTAALAWRAEIVKPTPVHARLPGSPRGRARKSGPRFVTPYDAAWLLVLGATSGADGRCWVRVRLPWRPNDATGWVNANRVHLRCTNWRVVVSRRARKLALRLAGRPVLRTRVVVGAPGTPTPVGLFSIVDVWRWNPADFLGSYILALTAHSNVLQEFGGGDGRVGLHGRGGVSLLDALGSAASHGCVRLPNKAIQAIVRRVGAKRLAGIPVRIS